MLATRTLEFDRIVDAVTALALTPLGAAALVGARAVDAIRKSWSRRKRRRARRSRFSSAIRCFRCAPARRCPKRSMPSRSQGRPLDPLQLRMVADFVDSVDQARASIGRAGAEFPILRELVAKVTAFKRRSRGGARTRSIRAARCSISASPELRRIRNELRQKRQKLRGTLEQYTRGSASKYLQDEVITERNGRFVLMVRAEHRGNVPGIVHGSSTTGATLFLEPAATVEINNDIVELEDREREEIFRILLELTDRFRARPADMTDQPRGGPRARCVAVEGALQLESQRHRA